MLRSTTATHEARASLVSRVTPDGAPALGLEAAHSRRRVLHAHDATGREIGRALWERVAPLPNVTPAPVVSSRLSPPPLAALFKTTVPF